MFESYIESGYVSFQTKDNIVSIYRLFVWNNLRWFFLWSYNICELCPFMKIVIKNFVV